MRWQDDNATHYEVGFEQQVATRATVIKRWHGAHDSAIRVMISAPVWFPGRRDATPALGLEAALGSLEAGKRADVILVNLEAPHSYPPNMPLYRLTCFASASDVDTVVIAGRVVMEGRRVLTIDERAVREAARLEAEAMLRRTGFGAMLATPANFWGPARGKMA